MTKVPLHIEFEEKVNQCSSPQEKMRVIQEYINKLKPIRDVKEE